MRNLALLFLILILAGACSGNKASHSPRPSPAPSQPLTTGMAPGSKGDILADLNGQPITEEEVMEKIRPKLTKIENALFNLKREGVDQIIEDRLIEAEAKKRGLSAKDLIKSEVDDKTGEVTDREAEDFYNANRNRFSNRTYEQAKTQIVSAIKNRKATVYRKNFIDRLLAKAQIDVYLERPKVEVSAGDSPAKGPESAAVTLIEFTDYECPFCAKARVSVGEVIADYKKDLRYVVRNFPLGFHANAKKAAVAALCADEQKKYWEYSQKLWENQKGLDVLSLKKYAADVKLDTGAFDQCLDSDKTLDKVNQDHQEGLKAGVTGTPAFFINGKMLTGAQPPEAFKKLIDEALRETKEKKAD